MKTLTTKTRAELIAEDSRKINGFEIALSGRRANLRIRLRTEETARFSPKELRDLAHWVAVTMANGHDDFHTRESLKHRADAIGTLLYCATCKPADRRFSLPGALDALDKAFS